MLDEEEFYDRNPEFKKIRAFLEFCAEGTFPLWLPVMVLEGPTTDSFWCRRRRIRNRHAQ